MMRYRIYSTGKVLLAIALAACLNTACGSSHSSSAITSATQSCPPKAKPLKVPEIDGQPLVAANFFIKCAGLRSVSPYHDANLDTPNDDIIISTPVQGSRVQADSVVTLIVSTGPNGCGTCHGIATDEIKGHQDMPPVCGLTFQKADITLAEDSITLDPKTNSRASADKSGTIIGSTPAVGTRFVAYGKGAVRVVVTVSSGNSASSAPPPSSGTQNACR